MRRYQLGWTFVNTEEEAKVAVEVIKHEMTPYCRKKYPPHYTPWQSRDGKENIFVVLYHY